MSLAQRLHRLQALERERELIEVAERLASEYDLHVDDVLRDLREVAARVERYGMDAQLRHLAVELGISEEEIQVRYAEALRECEAAP